MTKRTPTKVDWARLAAYIDGEGCIDIHTHNQFRKHLNRVHTAHYIRINIANTDFRLPVWCRDMFGGRVHLEHRKHRHKKWRDVAVWLVTSKRASEILRGVLPYLLLKREQADVALAFQATVKRIGRGGHTEETMNHRLELQQEIKDLKRRPSDEKLLQFPKTGTD